MENLESTSFTLSREDREMIEAHALELGTWFSRSAALRDILAEWRIARVTTLPAPEGGQPVPLIEVEHE